MAFVKQICSFCIKSEGSEVILPTFRIIVLHYAHKASEGNGN